MSDNSSSGGSGNSWTILTPEESGAESVGPLSEGQEDPAPSDPVHLHTKQPEPDISQESELTHGHVEQANAPEPPQVAPLDISTGASPVHGTRAKDDQIPGRCPVENLTSLTSDPEELGTSDERSDSESIHHPDTDAFSDSYTHISPSPATSQLPGASQEREELLLEEKDELKKTLKEELKPSFEESEEKSNEGDGLRRRNVSLLTALDHRDDEEEEEEEEEPFRPPQREEGVGLSLNKCIFGAVILLTLGTIFFSGALMDLDDEGDTEVKELKDTEFKKEWLNSEAPGNMAAEAQPPEVLEKLARESQIDPVLQAQQEEDASNAAQMQMKTDSQETMRREELEVENERMRGELDRLPALQKELEQENERVKKDLEALPGLQKELELLKAKVTELSQHTVRAQAASDVSDSVPPSAGHDSRFSTNQEEKELKNKKTKEKRKEGKERKEWEKNKKDKLKDEKPWKQKEGERKGQKGEKHWEKEQISQEEGKERRGRGERKEWNEEKDGKSGTKREDGKRRKDREEKREFKEDGGKREWKEDKKRHKEKQWELDGEKWETNEWKDDKTKEGKGWKHGGEKKEGKKEKEWKKYKQDRWNDENEWKDKERYKKDWEEKEEQYGEKVRSPKGDRKYVDKDWQEKKWKGEKDDYKRKDGKKEWKQKEEMQKSGRKREEWPKDGERTDRRKEEKKRKESHHKKVKKDSKEHLYSEQKHNGGHTHGDYWSEQREKIRHYHGSTEGCSGVTACALAEGISPVTQRDFETFLLGYLTRLDGSDEQASKTDKLKKLVGEFFANGVFVHDQIPFSEFVEDVADILEDMVDEEDEEKEDEMEGFAREAMEKFELSDRGEGEGMKREGGRKRALG